MKKLMIIPITQPRVGDIFTHEGVAHQMIECKKDGTMTPLMVVSLCSGTVKGRGTSPGLALEDAKMYSDKIEVIGRFGRIYNEA